MKIALIENFGSDFYGARLRYALFLKDKGHHVIAIVPNDGFAEKIKAAGIATISLDIDIRERSLSNVIRFATKLKIIFRREHFDIIHFYRMQPNLVGTPVAYFFSRGSKVFNHITGLGVAFTKNSLKYNFLKFVIKSLYNVNSSIFAAKLIFQNSADKIEVGNSSRFVVVKGSAVDEDTFNLEVKCDPEIKKELIDKYRFSDGLTLIFVSRLLKQKGLSYLIEAVEKCNSNPLLPKVNVVVAGWIDPKNPDSFTDEEIEVFKTIEGVVFLGKRKDINQLILLSDIAVLPTYYREGTPRFLLESMAMGKPILTTNMPGCSHLIDNNKNGALILPQNSFSIVEAIQKLQQSDLSEMGRNSRLLYEKEFSEKIVYGKLLELYGNS